MARSAAYLLALVLSTPVWVACKGSKAMSENISPSRSADSILAKVGNSFSFHAEEVRGYQENPKVYQALLERLRSLPGAERAACVDRFDDLGAHVETPAGEAAPMLAPYMSDPVLIRGLVDLLGDPDAEVRQSAANRIVASVPDLYLRNHVGEVLERVAARPEIGRAAQLLAKTGSQKALAMVRGNGVIRGQDALWTSQALAKLGDSLEEDRLIEAYRKEKAEGPKRELALSLGFVATPKAILALARDLRNPMTYEWNQTARRSFRIHVIEGLSRAYPMEPLLWKPNGAPRDDGYYRGIETWAKSKLGVDWDVPRPPFLYETEVPAMPPGPTDPR